MVTGHETSLTQDAAAATVGRRAAARLRLAIPARFVSVTATQGCILLDISRSGARIALESPAPTRKSGYIEIGRLELFGMVVRSERLGDGGINAVAFDDPISEAEVLAIRRFAEAFEQRERQTLRDQVRRWVSGEP
ncbi:PilZ domain-containing protein [Erythrobacter oryzae]|uniref:PilZ domain-containing protein n=1 Tax=Erythrobacter oryzae TaxID=3019556 RepID=UPI00255546B7|nr:PilZ domain-containing protein [Erythrobacter sp. COR-2]